MSSSQLDSKLYGSLFSDPEVAREFSDDRLLQLMLKIEAELAQVEERFGIIPQGAAEKIAGAANSLKVDWEKLGNAIRKDGFPVGGLVAQLRTAAGEAGSFVHWGATTQDIFDTARVLQMRECLAQLEAQLGNLILGLADLAERYRGTLMAGRTHSQQALPITFGFKVAGWLAPLLRYRERLEQLKPRVLVVQLGGGVGTLSAFGEKGLDIQSALAEALGLGLLVMPWHTQRDGIAEVAGCLAGICGSLGKMAQDVILLSQGEIGEVSEPDAGGSSAMPHKQNPIQAELILGAARHSAALLSSIHHSLIQEHERGTQGWQLELMNLPQMFALAASSLKRALYLSEGLVVNTDRMRANVDASHGLMLSEALSQALRARRPADESFELVREAALLAAKEGRHLVDALREHVEIDLDWESLRKEENSLGSSVALVDAVVAQAREALTLT